ncbi:hypothetical protein [Bradyrhizobium roseum]|uniref:hypothetical protein n=1 Tax=Bradyrhizobium roseum TaxID=3056648 RepID=UPI002616EAD7|nr:hypothetical protein [Bradyrhizobium roseus]WKA31608.1 hypothetical protein QUH67_16240 [Bradyrhizobium roseus]
MRRPAQLRKPAAISAPTPKTAKPATFPAPVGGWIKNAALATPGARLPDGSKVNGAYILDNWFPTTTAVRMRGGSQVFATLGDGSRDVVAMFAYVNGNNKKLFGATSNAIYDATSGGAIASAAVGSQTGGAWSAVQFATSGGVFIRAVNGADPPQVYDGASWSTSPAITGSGLTPSTLSNVWVHQKRLFFIQKDTLNAWYLPADAIGGVAVVFPLGGVFKLGGALLFGATWSIESGSGLTELCVFVTTEGEAAIYQGTDPASASTFSKVGVYRIGKPLGPNALISAGGDLAIATNIGLVPLSQAVQRDFAALSPIAISYKIEEGWNDAVADRISSGWSCAVWPTKQLVLVAPAESSAGERPVMFATNARTGSWGRAIGWNGRCLQLFGDRMFFGSTGGKIIEAEVTGADQGMPYTSTCVWLFDPLKAAASLKTCLLMRAVIRSVAHILPQLSLQADYVLSLPTAPDDAGLPTGSVWGTGTWGVSLWGGTIELSVFKDWQSVGGAGYSIAPAVQITSGSIVSPKVELVQVDMTYDQGDIVS